MTKSPLFLLAVLSLPFSAISQVPEPEPVPPAPGVEELVPAAPLPPVPATEPGQRPKGKNERAGGKLNDATKGNGNGKGNGKGNGNGNGNNESTPTSGPGNYNLLRLSCGSGAACVRRQLAGGNADCLTPGDTVGTEPGNTVGPVAQGLNTRFGRYQGPVSSSEFPPDTVTTENISFAEYEQRQASGTFDFDPPDDGVPQRRVIAVVFSYFGAPSGGTNDLTVAGFGCFFLTRQVAQSGDQTVTAELTTDCNLQGPSNPLPPGSAGFTRIILYKDPGSNQT